MSATTPLSFLTLPQRLRPPTEQWRKLAWQLVCDLRVAIPCVIKSFDAEKQTITAQPVIQEKINKDLVPTDVDLPLLVDVPIVVPRAGLYALTLPVQEGDECLVVFADMCIDSWYQSGGEKNVQVDKRRHDLSDGFALLGCWSQPRKLKNYSVDTVQLRGEDGATYLEIDETDINIVAPDGGSVNINVAGDASVNLAADTGKISLTSNEEIDITAPTVKIAGATLVDITGGNSKVDGKVFLTHKHTGVQTGGGNTGSVL